MESNIFKRFGAALIDMDGVLYDSMAGHTLAWHRMMTEAGIECSREEFYLYEGMTGIATVNLLMQRAFGHGCGEAEALAMYEVKSRYFRESGAASPMPGADRMLTALKEGGLKRVLVTGSGQKSLLEGLDRDYPEIFYPEMRVTAHDVKHGKPDPEPYLLGARKAGLSPAECVVVENAPLGVRAGKAAGCFTIAVTTGPIPREEFEKEGADLIFPSMPDFASFLESQLFDCRLETEIGEIERDKTFVLIDSNVKESLRARIPFADGEIIIPAGEGSKSLRQLAAIWERLVKEGATRRSLIINVGGGVVTDLGGFAAACFKRGIRYVNVPTSLLAMADAASGGKTGIDFMGLKNEIGAFHMPEKAVLMPWLLNTLPPAEMLSGFAEVIKTAMISDREIYEELLSGDALADKDLMAKATRHAFDFKQDTVSLDPKERGLRKILNFGHTAGHAFESLALKKGLALTHGEAVAHGILVALRLSRVYAGFPEEEIERYRTFILERYFRPLPFGREDAEALTDLMRHDKKNSGKDALSFVLLEAYGKPVIMEITDMDFSRLYR